LGGIEKKAGEEGGEIALILTLSRREREKGRKICNKSILHIIKWIYFSNFIYMKKIILFAIFVLLSFSLLPLSF
jgi:hypothetical protein